VISFGPMESLWQILAVIFAIGPTAPIQLEILKCWDHPPKSSRLDKGYPQILESGGEKEFRKTVSGSASLVINLKMTNLAERKQWNGRISRSVKFGDLWVVRNLRNAEVVLCLVAQFCVQIP